MAVARGLAKQECVEVMGNSNLGKSSGTAGSKVAAAAEDNITDVEADVAAAAEDAQRARDHQDLAAGSFVRKPVSSGSDIELRLKRKLVSRLQR